MNIYIYGLVGGDGEIRYVGKSYRPKIRLYQHIYNAKKGEISHKSNWIRKVLENDLSIDITILDCCNESNWEEKERFWIEKLKTPNNLTNISIGGEGGGTCKFTMSLSEVKEWVRYNLPHIKTESDWRKSIRNNEIPDFIPKRPDSVFKNNGWVSYSDLLNIQKIFITYDELKIYVINNEIKSKKEYEKIRNKNTMPRHPERFYESIWISWRDFLNKKITKKEKIRYLNYNDLKSIIKKYNFTKAKDYTNWYIFNTTYKVPRNPIKFYKGEWVSWQDFFGNNIPKIINTHKKQKLTHFLSYVECKKWVNENLENIKGEKYWRTITKTLPFNIPKRPDYIYKNNGWISWKHFLKN